MGPAGVVTTCAVAGKASSAAKQMAIRLASRRISMIDLPNPGGATSVSAPSDEDVDRGPAGAFCERGHRSAIERT
jgi:hypothetical protein